MPVIDNIADFSIQRTDGNRMVLMDNRGQVVVSTDGGKIWRKAGEAPGLYRSRVRLDNADGNRIYVVSRDPRKEQQRFWVSTNAGTDWTALSNTGQPTGLPDLPINAFEQDPANAATLWAGTFIGLYRSTDAGQTWARYGEGLPSVPVMDIKIAANGSLIRIGTFGRGVWEVRPTAGSAAPGTVAGPANPPRTLAAPVASFDVTTAEPRPGRRVAFADTSSGIPSSWSWKFGDGGTSKEENPSHVFLTPGTYNVELTATNASGSGTTTRSVSVAFPNTGTGDALTYLLPAVLVAAGQGGSLFSTELTLVNRASVPLSLTFRTKGATESSATYTLQVGQQVFPDAIAFLRERGAALPAGNVTVSLRIEVRGAGEIGQFGSQVRITTPPNESQRAQGIAGRFGLAFPAIPLRTAANREAVVYGLQQTSETGQAGTRSNLACVNAGGGSAIELEVTYHDGETGKDHAQKDSFSLATFEFQQKSTPLRSRAIKRGWATIKRTSGDSQFFCYGVLNDNLNSDGSFVPMLNVDAAEPASSAVVPVVVGTDTFKSELTLANRTKKKISGEMAVIPSTTGEPEYGSFEIEAGRQDVYPDIVASLRQAGFTLPSGTVASIYITFENAGSTGGDDPRAGDDDPPAPVSTSDAYVNIRTYATRAGGLFGQAYGQVPLGRAADTEAYVFGLQQTGTRGVEGGTRANLAIIHALSGLEEDMVLEVTYFGPSGQELGKEADTTLKPGQWKQFNSPLQRFDVPGGYARIRRLSGSDQFIAYGVLNDQANDDGSFVPMTVP